MREVQLVWDAHPEQTTVFGGLTSVLESMEVLSHLEIAEDGVRQIIAPEFLPGKSIEDLEDLSFLKVEEHFEANGTMVVWNSHPLVSMASKVDNIHILPPYGLANNEVKLTIRGLPQTVAAFVKLCRMSLPPKHIRVQTVRQPESFLKELLSSRQYDCFHLASKHGLYHGKEGVTLQFLADMLGIARSTFQEHLKAAENAILAQTSLDLLEEA